MRLGPWVRDANLMTVSASGCTPPVQEDDGAASDSRGNPVHSGGTVPDSHPVTAHRRRDVALSSQVTTAY
ncbi:hypothetical protein GCM10019016_079750 [Streptomyces prasinosporus]|uniref:Uncharacterized protein n=1 Tax=Streptomyces prasinosporus TaxID=68256 RepID=A0ABP6TZP5_9ACTN|nr:hypothetical protein GCM10010332_49960 [Streptomyces albogriseolus]